jgi:hypothetical protein
MSKNGGIIGIGSWPLGGAGDGGARWDVPRPPPGGTRGRGPAEASAPPRRPKAPAPRGCGVSRARARVGGEAPGACLGRCHDGGAAYPGCRPSPVPTAFHPTIAERIKDYCAQNVADWVMYRTALASAAEARGWRVHWYDAESVLGPARRALRVENLDAHFIHVRRAVGSPWDKDHELAMAAAIVTCSD